MGCGASSASKACADQELETAVAKFPASEVEGSEEKLGMGQAEKEFDTIKSFNWTFGGTGSVKIGRVQDVTLNKTPKIQLEIEECTGIFKCDNLANGNVTIKKANIFYMHETCQSTVKVHVCNCLIIIRTATVLSTLCSLIRVTKEELRSTLSKWDPGSSTYFLMMTIR